MGKYNDVPGLGTVCPDCQKGKYAPATGYALCTDCIVGTYASDDGSTECTQCEEGKHSGVHGSETCDDCAACTFTDYRGAVTSQGSKAKTPPKNSTQRNASQVQIYPELLL